MKIPEIIYGIRYTEGKVLLTLFPNRFYWSQAARKMSMEVETLFEYMIEMYNAIKVEDYVIFINQDDAEKAFEWCQAKLMFDKMRAG